MNKKVSIIIPMFNAKKFINNALESCKSQTYRNIEVIVVDDGSTDGISKKDIVTNDCNIVYHSQVNKGPGIARNTGMKISTGDYIFFLDADDIIPPDAIHILMNNIGTNDVVIGKTERIFLDKNNYSYKRSIWKDDIYKKEVPSKYDLILNTLVTDKLYKKEFLFNNNIFFEKGLILEDKLFILKVFEKTENYIVINKIVHKWSIHYQSNSLTNQVTVKKLQDRMAVNYQCINYTSDEKLKSVLIENIINHDLKIYVNASIHYSFEELLDLYLIYFTFYNTYKADIDKMNVQKNILKNIKYKYLTIIVFLSISLKKKLINFFKYKN